MKKRDKKKLKKEERIYLIYTFIIVYSYIYAHADDLLENVKKVFEKKRKRERKIELIF